MLLNALVVKQHVIKRPTNRTAIATADGVITTGTADRTAVEEVTITIVTEVGTELGLPLQTLQPFPDVTEVNLSVEATQQTEVITIISTLVPLIDD